MVVNRSRIWVTCSLPRVLLTRTPHSRARRGAPHAHKLLLLSAPAAGRPPLAPLLRQRPSVALPCAACAGEAMRARRGGEALCGLVGAPPLTPPHPHPSSRAPRRARRILRAAGVCCAHPLLRCGRRGRGCCLLGPDFDLPPRRRTTPYGSGLPLNGTHARSGATKHGALQTAAPPTPSLDTHTAASTPDRRRLRLCPPLRPTQGAEGAPLRATNAPTRARRRANAQVGPLAAAALPPCHPPLPLPLRWHFRFLTALDDACTPVCARARTPRQTPLLP